MGVFTKFWRVLNNFSEKFFKLHSYFHFLKVFLHKNCNRNLKDRKGQKSWGFQAACNLKYFGFSVPGLETP
jgi:hypothetical protein